MGQSGQVYATGESAPIRGAYQIIGHAFPAEVSCLTGDLERERTVSVGQGDPAPAHDACGKGALWILASVAGMSQREPIPARSAA